MFPNPSLDALTNVANHVAYAMQMGYAQEHVDIRMDTLINHLSQQKLS